MMNLAPAEVMMCAAHNNDLAAAQNAGLATAFIPRPTEFGPRQTTDLGKTQKWDIIATDLNNLALQLGISQM